MKQVDLQGNVWDCSVGNFEPPISAYGSINLDELNQVMERLNKVPNYDDLIRDNNKKQQEIERLNNIINELKDWIKDPKNQNSSDGYQVVSVDELLEKIG